MGRMGSMPHSSFATRQDYAIRARRRKSLGFSEKGVFAWARTRVRGTVPGTASRTGREGAQAAARESAFAPIRTIGPGAAAQAASRAVRAVVKGRVRVIARPYAIGAVLRAVPAIAFRVARLVASGAEPRGAKRWAGRTGSDWPRTARRPAAVDFGWPFA